MKIKFLYTTTLLLAIFLLFANVSTGPTVLVGDLTLSPLSGGSCDGCHDHADRFSPLTTISVKDSVGNLITNGLYKPLHNYTITVQVFAPPSNQIPAITPLYGAQAVVLKLSQYFPQAGILSNPSTDSDELGTGARLFSFDGRNYLEHTQRCTSGIFNIKWQAPPAGTGNLGIYAAGLAINNSGTLEGDDFDTTAVFLQEDLSINISKLENQILNYNIFPTPSLDGQFFIEGLDGDYSIQLYNLLGQMVWEKTLLFNASPTPITPYLPRGIYTIIVQQGNRKDCRIFSF